MQQSRYSIVDAYIERFSDGEPVVGLDETTLLFKYKKSNETSLTIKTFFNVTGVLEEDVAAGDKVIIFDDQAALDFFPMKGKVWIDKGLPGGEPLPIPFTRIATFNYLTLSTGVTLPHLTGALITLHDFWEVGNGIYSFLLNSEETNTLGPFIWLADPTDIANKNFIKFDEITPATTSEFAPEIISLPTCFVYGYILGPDGQPEENVSAAFRIVAEPELINNTSLITRPIMVKTDESGYFSVLLIQGTTVEVYIPETTFRKVFDVPESDTYELYY